MPPESRDDPAGREAAAELLLGLFITAFALFVIEESARMPRRGHLGLVMSPGFVPLFTGTVLLLLSLVIDLRALRRGGHRHLGQWLGQVVADDESRRFLVVVGLMSLYVVGLLGRVPFLAATLVFHLLIFIYLKIGGPFKIGFYTALATFLVAYLLPGLFEMPVP